MAALQQTNQFTKVQVKVDARGRRDCDVQFILEPAYYVGIVTFPGAPGEFVYTRLLQAVNIPEQSPFFEDLLPQGQKALEQFLQVQGYFTATVEPRLIRTKPTESPISCFGFISARSPGSADIELQGSFHRRGRAYPCVRFIPSGRGSSAIR